MNCAKAVNEKTAVIIGAFMMLHDMPDIDKPFLDDNTQALRTDHSNGGTPSNGFALQGLISAANELPLYLMNLNLRFVC